MTSFYLKTEYEGWSSHNLIVLALAAQSSVGCPVECGILATLSKAVHSVRKIERFLHHHLQKIGEHYLCWIVDYQERIRFSVEFLPPEISHTHIPHVSQDIRHVQSLLAM